MTPLPVALQGPYALTSEVIEENVKPQIPGIFVLGDTRRGVFNACFIGRADDDIGCRLKEHIGRYAEFKFEYLRTPQAAFERQCGLYHDYGPPHNRVHPVRAPGTPWRCPRCNILP